MKQENEKAMSLKPLNMKELRVLAAKLDIGGRSRMTRAELIRSIRLKFEKNSWLEEPAEKKVRMPVELGVEKKAARKQEADSEGPAAESQSSNRAMKNHCCLHFGEPTAPPYLDRGMPVPDTYGDDRLKFMVKDPMKGYVYWELSGPVAEGFRSAYGDELFSSKKWTLRVKSLRSREVRDVPVDLGSCRAYLDLSPGCLYQIQLGFHDESQEFVTVLTAEPRETPRERISSIVDESWSVRSNDLEDLVGANEEEVRRAGSSSIWQARFSEIAGGEYPTAGGAK